MPDAQSPLPIFRRPPVREVAIAVQFEAIELLAVHIGMLALQWRAAGYPRLSDQPSLPPVIERFEDSGSPDHIVFEFGPPSVRHWFISEDDRHLIQLQRDRFICNWRAQAEDDAYPTYSALRAVFDRHLKTLVGFASAECGSTLHFSQIELTYVNRIGFEDGAECSLGNVLHCMRGDAESDMLPSPEVSALVQRFVLTEGPDPIGRLHVEASCDQRVTGPPSINLVLTARGAPPRGDQENVMQGLDRLHVHAVRAFEILTTERMHRQWEKQTW